ncbi:hypothetical protein ACHHYP_16013 [Achlya hypogyna]|uniref:EF-hand domain-containing protein n=1 Tax=Achlya hypogyna TaxID=1202772 RepID=A0A1V9ZED6_ACHHY|nr:hypothetical protein ACHHYP_16013 [Achlya hypogyna]
MSRPTSAPARAIYDELYLAQLLKMPPDGSSVNARVLQVKRQTRDFVDAVYTNPNAQDTIEPLTPQTSLPCKSKPRPKTSVPVMRLKRELSSAASIVKHPTRLIAQKLSAAIEAHVANRPSANQDGTDVRFEDHLLYHTNEHHNFFHNIVDELATHMDTQPTTVGVGPLLRRVWDVYVAGLYHHVDQAKKLGLQYYHQQGALADSQTTPKHSEIESKTLDAAPFGSTTHAATRSRRCYVVAVESQEIAELKRLLSAKAVKALRIELVSIQRLRESIFTSVINVKSLRKADQERRSRLHLSQQIDQHSYLQQRYAVVSEEDAAAAIVIQRVLRGKIAARHCHFLRIVELMKIKTHHLFEKSLNAKEARELASATPLTLHELEMQFTGVVWEVQRLVRDLSLDWWKLSLSEERTRLAWELSDARDDIRQVSSLVSILLQNCTNMMQVVTQPRSMITYVSPTAQVIDSTKQLLDMIARMNVAIEDFVNARNAHDFYDMCPAATQTDAGFGRHPSYLEALAAIAQTITSPPESESDDDEDVYAFTSTMSLNGAPNAAPNAIENTSDSSVEEAAPTKTRRKPLAKRPKKKRYGARNVLANVPANFRGVFKLLGVTRGYKARPLSLPHLKLLFHELYVSRMQVEEYSRPLPEFIYQFFMRKFGLRKVAESHLVDLMASLKKYWRQDPEVHLFARFCSLKNTKPLSIDAFDYFISLLAHLYEKDPRQSSGSTQQPGLRWDCNTSLSKNQAIASLSRFEPPRMLELINFQPEMELMRIEEYVNSRPVVVEGKHLGVGSAHILLERDDLLTFYVHEFENIETQISTMLTEIFANADIDHNGELTLGEFNSIVQKIEPTPMWEVQRMFFEAVTLTANVHADVVTADAFVIVAKKQGLGSRALTDTRRNALTIMGPMMLNPAAVADFNARNP